VAERGKYVVFEGGDGVGKSTTMHLVAGEIRDRFKVEVYTVEEPGSIRDSAGNVLVPIADELRTIIKDKELARSAFTNVLLFNAARRENWLQVMKPALENGIWVLGARNWWSTIAYQGAGEGIDSGQIKEAVEMATSSEYATPDFGFILDLDEIERSKRVAGRDNKQSGDTFESRPDEFQIAVREGYRAFAKENNIPIIPTDVPAEDVSKKIMKLILDQYSLRSNN
jgi:dTMP kinase